MTWLVAELKNLGIKSDIWLDESFLTKKIEPDDIDLVVDVPAVILDNANGAQADFLCDKQLHAFIICNAPISHPFYLPALTSRNQWMKDFGYAYGSKAPKGIAVMGVSP